MTDWPPLDVRVWGDFACFTRPELKVERVSYPVMTPSAARGILEAIFWKPEFRWRVREIEVLRPVRFVSLVRNEVTVRASDRVDLISVADSRTQRHALALRDVVYVIRADIVLRAGVTDNVAKYRDQFRRRIERSACAFRPYLGTREFAAHFSPVEADERPEAVDLRVGSMLLDLEYEDDRSGLATPVFFDAEVTGGRLVVPRIGGLG